MTDVSAMDWVDQEMRSLNLGDRRLEDRARKILFDLSQQPTGSIPEFCHERAASQAAYNFFRNAGVDAAAILAAQRQATLARIKAGGYPLVLAIQDTTEFNFSPHPATTGLGPLDNPVVQGFFSHTTLAVSPVGLPLGSLAQHTWVRQATTEAQKSGRPIEQKESYKWFTGLDESSRDLPATVTVLEISDRESDIYEYFVHPRPDNVALLVRVWRERPLADEAQPLWPTLQRSPVRGKVQVEVQRHPNQPARTAECQVQYQRVKLRPPKKRPGLPADLKPVVLWAVLVEEKSPPAGVEPLCWLLLTTLEVTSFDQACQMIEYYTHRWLIERFHFVLKSGCALEQRQLRDLDRLERFLALANVVAWRLLWLTYAGRLTPDLPCTVALATEEWQALYCFIHKTALAPTTPPTLQQAIRWIAQLGGFLGRKSDGQPGVKVLWRGWRRLFDLVQTWLIFNTS